MTLSRGHVGLVAPSDDGDLVGSTQLQSQEARSEVVLLLALVACSAALIICVSLFTHDMCFTICV